MQCQEFLGNIEINLGHTEFQWPSYHNHIPKAKMKDTKVDSEGISRGVGKGSWDGFSPLLDLRKEHRKRIDYYQPPRIWKPNDGSDFNYSTLHRTVS